MLASKSSSCERRVSPVVSSAKSSAKKSKESRCSGCQPTVVEDEAERDDSPCSVYPNFQPVLASGGSDQWQSCERWRSTQDC